MYSDSVVDPETIRVGDVRSLPLQPLELRVEQLKDFAEKLKVEVEDCSVAGG